MEAGFMVIAFIAVSIAFALGYLLGKAGKAGKQIGAKGTIYVITNEHDGRQYPYLESNVPMEDLASIPKATFNIKAIRQNSHE